VRAFNHRRCGLSTAQARERFEKIKNPPTRKCAITEFVDIFQRAHYQDQVGRPISRAAMQLSRSRKERKLAIRARKSKKKKERVRDKRKSAITANHLADEEILHFRETILSITLHFCERILVVWLVLMANWRQKLLRGDNKTKSSFPYTSKSYIQKALSLFDYLILE